MSTIRSFGTLVETINRHYELPQILSLEAIPSPRSNTADQEAVYRIFTSKDSYVLRRYRTDSLDAIASHNRFLDWAEQNSYRLSQRIIRTRSDSDMFEFQNHRWWLALYVEADESYQWTQPDWNAEVCHEAGKALVELHLLLREFGKELKPAQLNYWMGEPSVTAYVEDRLRSALDNAGMFSEQAPAFLALLQGSLKRIANAVNEDPLRVHQLVHGDFHPGNLLLRSGEAVAVIDFEYLHFEEVSYDVAYALVMFCAGWSDADSNALSDGVLNDGALNDGASNDGSLNDSGLSDGVLNPIFVQEFLRGYSTGGIVLDPDLLFAFMVVAASVNLTWLLERPSDRAKAVHFVNLLSRLENFSTINLPPSTERSEL